MKKKYVHIASFSGNIGDIINHLGFYESVVPEEMISSKIEIRRFYNNCRECSFDNNLAEAINRNDGLILGGGGFFDVRWGNSSTGTTINMSSEFIDSIRVPVLVNAMGIHFDDTNPLAIKRFCQFLDYVLNRDNWMISIRNDGSISRLLKKTGIYDERIISVPDNGFLFRRSNCYSDESNIVGLSFSSDLISDEYNGGITDGCFVDELSKVCKYLLEEGKELLFYLHAPQDIEMLSKLYIKLGNALFRENIRIAPFDVYTRNNAYAIDELYRKCSFVISMRFHGCVTGIKNLIPTIGLAGHEQIQGLFEELELNDQFVIAEDGFSEVLIDRIKTFNNNLNVISEKQSNVMSDIVASNKRYSLMVGNFLRLYDGMEG